MKTKLATKKSKPDYSLSFLRKENDLNKILKAHKRAPERIRILYISLWDDNCKRLVDKLKVAEAASSKNYTLYVVDSYNMPHSFVIYKTTQVPQLVTLNKNKVSVEGYLPRIYDALGVQ